jgi:hypothetical protein
MSRNLPPEPGESYQVQPGELFPEITRHTRVIPRGISGVSMFMIAAVVVVYGHWKVAQGYKKRMDIKHQRNMERITLIPFLQAESDRDYLRSRRELLELEEKYCKDIPGWVVGEGVYNTRWMPPFSQPGGKWFG